MFLGAHRGNPHSSVTFVDFRMVTGRAGRAGSYDGTVFVWELARGTVAGTLTGSGNTPVLGCAWCPQARCRPAPAPPIVAALLTDRSLHRSRRLMRGTRRAASLVAVCWHCC